MSKSIPRALMLRKPLQKGPKAGIVTVDALESLYPDGAGLAWHASADAPALQPLTLTRHRYSGPEVVALVMPSRLA